MFNWVVKVVPQPPESRTDEPAKDRVAECTRIKKASTDRSLLPKNTDDVSEDSQSNPSILGWLSNGFVSALPQPAGSPCPTRVTSDTTSGEDRERSGMMDWVTQGLTKVLPQPEEKYKERDNICAEEHTEVYDVATMPDFDPLPHIPVVEMVSDDEASETEDLSSNFPPNVVTWIKHMIPQPVILPPGAVPLEPAKKTSRSSLDKILSPPPESLSGISLDTDSKASGMVGWFVSGLGLKIPQPAIPSKNEGVDDILQKASCKLNPDMVLEDIESDGEGQHNPGSWSRAAVPTTSMTQPSTAEREKLEVTQQMQPNSPTEVTPSCGHTNPNSLQPHDTTGIFQEDAETQTGRWTPFIESIKKEAEDVAFATMEERLLQERMEMARLAEEVARQTAEMAIRQIATEGQSIKLSLESQEMLDELDPELLVPQEGSEAETCRVTDEEESLDKEAQEEAAKEFIIAKQETENEIDLQRKSPSRHASPEPRKSSELDPKPIQQPESKIHETKSEAVTQQPQKAAQKPEEESGGAKTDHTAEKEEDSPGDECGAPVSCDTFKNCLMRIPHTSECLGNINAFFKENGISHPKIPSICKFPSQISEVTKVCPSLPPELRKELSQIRLTQVPRNIAQTLTAILPVSSEGSVSPSLSGLTQSFSNIPQKLSEFPTRTQNYFLNIRNRLNSLMPQDA